MSVAVKRTLIRPKGREEYESNNTMASIVSTVAQTVVAQGSTVVIPSADNSNTSSSSNRAPARTESSSEALPYYAGKNIVVNNRQISSPNSVQSPIVEHIKVMRQSEYDALTAYTENTLYFCYEPAYSGLTLIADQTALVFAEGVVLTSSNLGDYFAFQVMEDLDDGSQLDVTSASTVTVHNTSYQVPTNTSGQEQSHNITGGLDVTWSGHTENFEVSIKQSAY